MTHEALPDLVAWAIFAKVAETGSFARAANELGLAQGTVSKAITRLEQRLRTTLFHRTSRRLSLTDAGRQAQGRASRLLAEGEALEAEVVEGSRSLRGAVRVATPMSFGIAHVAPLLPSFLRQHPEVQIDLQLSDAQVDLVAGGYDFALRIATLADSSLLARRLCTVRILLVGAPAYLEAHGRPTHPRDLAAHQALQYGHGAGGGAQWRFRHPRQGEFTQSMPVVLRANNAEALAPALRAGLGLALQPTFLAWDDVQAGTLEAVMCDWAVDPIALFIVMPPGRGRPARVQALIEHFAAALGNAPWAAAPPPSGLPRVSGVST